MKTMHDSETPKEGQQVITACAFIHHDFEGTKKVFLPKRAATKKFLPDVYELPGGHIDFGENLVTGLKREICEEFGMEIEVGDSFAAFDYTNEIKGSHSIEVIYFAQFSDSIDKIKLDPEDHSVYEWFSSEDVISRKNEIVAEEFADHESGTDPEYLTILRGFELLKAGKLKF